MLELHDGDWIQRHYIISVEECGDCAIEALGDCVLRWGVGVVRSCGCCSILRGSCTEHLVQRII